MGGRSMGLISTDLQVNRIERFTGFMNIAAFANRLRWKGTGGQSARSGWRPVRK